MNNDQIQQNYNYVSFGLMYDQIIQFIIAFVSANFHFDIYTFFCYCLVEFIVYVYICFICFFGGG